MVDGKLTPDANDEFLLYQTLIGAWPSDGNTLEGLQKFRERIAAYMVKAVKEAKANTRWSEPNLPYEEAITVFTERLLTDNANNIFLDDLRRFHRRVAFFGQFNSLSQTLLKITSPGFPDFYQGTELWDLSLVDPDNRRPVDYDLRRRLLATIQENFAAAQKTDIGPFLSDLLRTDHWGVTKLFLIWRALNYRRTEPELFATGHYIPLSTSGKKHRHLCAFARVQESRAAIVVVPRLVYGLTQGEESPPLGAIWEETTLTLPHEHPATTFRNVLTGETLTTPGPGDNRKLKIADVLKHFPVALLECLPAS
jgi:(1->4)-alpha-D-glucan 1-alpha-D-glucosylmutase